MAKTYTETLLNKTHLSPRMATVRITKDVVHIPCEGIGVNITLDAQAGNCYPELNDEQGWRCLLDNLSWLSPRWICLTLPAEEVVSQAGKVIENAVVLKRLDRFCGWAEEKKVNIDLMLPKSTPDWLKFKMANCPGPAPADIGAYANLVCNVMEYLIRAKGYGRIKYLTIFGEPFNEDGGYFSFGTPDGIDPYSYYVDLLKSVRKALDGRNLSDLGLLGPNSADVYAHLETMKRLAARGLNLGQHLAAVDMHSYRVRLNYLPPAHQVPTCPMNEYVNNHLRPAVAQAVAQGKPFFITELGCMYYGKSVYGDPRGPSRHAAFITEAELIVRGLNLGVDGFLKWVYLFDNRQSRAHYQLLDLTDGVYLRKRGFYGYGALCRHFPAGAKVLRAEVKETGGESLHVAVIRSKAGEVTTMFLVNDHPADMLDVHINGIDSKKSFHKFVFDHSAKAEKGEACSRTDNGNVTLRLTPLSLTVLTNAAPMFDNSTKGPQLIRLIQ